MPTREINETELKSILRRVLEEYVKQASGILGFLTTWQSDPSLSVFLLLAQYVDGVIDRDTLTTRLPVVKLKHDSCLLDILLHTGLFEYRSHQSEEMQQIVFEEENIVTM